MYWKNFVQFSNDTYYIRQILSNNYTVVDFTCYDLYFIFNAIKALCLENKYKLDRLSNR